MAGLAGLGLCGLILGQLLIEPANYRMDYLAKESENLERASTAHVAIPRADTQATRRTSDPSTDSRPSRVPATPPITDNASRL